MKNLLIIFFFGLILQACNTVKMEKDASKASPSIVYSKSPCFGECPIYTLTIYNTGLAKFNGRRFTKMDGKHEKQLDKTTYVNLVKAFRKNRFWRFDDTYGMDLVDAPTTTIAFSDKDKSKTVKGKSEFPEKLRELMTMLDTIVNNTDGWNMTDKPSNLNKKKEIIDNQIIIKIKKTMMLSRWLQENKKNSIRLLKRIGGENDLWLIRFDKTKFKPEEMLKMLREDKDIQEAEFNTKVSNR